MQKYFPHKIIKYQLYLFQLEEYDSKRYFQAIRNKGLFPTDALRKDLVWTQKIRVLLGLSLFIQIGFALIISYLFNSLVFDSIIAFVVLFMASLYIIILVSFLFYIQSQDIIRPIENIQKRKIIDQATRKLKELRDRTPTKSSNENNPIIIGITGSYGKTTMKEVLSKILSVKYNVVSTFENQNTPIGIARKIINSIDDKTEIFIVEMGEYVKGDVDTICKITPPDISIITGINEAHLERYGTMQNAIDTKFEILENTKKSGLILLNADDALTVENYQRFSKDKNIQWYSSKSNKLSRYKINEVNLDLKRLGLDFKVKDSEFDIDIILKTKFLAEYVIGNVIASLIIAKKLGMNTNEFKFGTSKIKPVEHRLEPSYLEDDVIIIDDTYNGNSDGIREGISLLKKFKDRRKVYITPGLVETGSLTEDLHLEIGRQLANVADLVILIRNSVTSFIEQGLLEEGFSSENIIWYEDGKTAYSSLREFVKKGDVVMMQNDWSDNYS